MAKQEKPFTKSELLAKISEKAEISKKQAALAFDAVAEAIQFSVGSNGVGKFVLPGLLKIEKKHVEAKPAQKHVPNPFKPGEFVDRKAKPAHDTVKIKALSGLKEVVKKGGSKKK